MRARCPTDTRIKEATAAVAVGGDCCKTKMASTPIATGNERALTRAEGPSGLAISRALSRRGRSPGTTVERERLSRRDSRTLDGGETTRAEGPPVSSHARKGVVCIRDEFEGRRPGTAIVPHFGARLRREPSRPLRPSLFFCRRFGLGCAPFTVSVPDRSNAFALNSNARIRRLPWR
jgi:hypothetical protein